MIKPKAIFFGGLPGAGKSSYVNLLKRNVKFDFIVINSDNFAEPLLAQYNLLKMKSFNEKNKEVEIQEKILSEAKKLTAEQIEKVLKKRKNIILDATSRIIEEIKIKKEELEKIGYETFFVFIYIDINKAIERNKLRKRSLHSSTIMAMNDQINKIIENNSYKLLFKSNFAIINNNTDTNIAEFERMLKSNHPPKNSIDEMNIKVFKKIIDWVNKKKKQNIEFVAKTITDYLFDTMTKKKFNEAIKRIKESYQFRI